MGSKISLSMYKVDENGYPVEYKAFTNEYEVRNLSSDWVPSAIPEEFPNPRWDKIKKKWLNGDVSPEHLIMLKDEKINQLSIACAQEILKGFKAVINGIEYHFNYEADNQQNFSDTIRLFENNMIKTIGWNAYVDGEKVRLNLVKEEFNQIYIEGVKHKTNCLTTLNDYLIPMVKSVKTEDELNLIYWGQGIHSDDMDIDDSKTIEKKTNKLEIDNSRNANGILELTNLILMGGF